MPKSKPEPWWPLEWEQGKEFFRPLRAFTKTHPTVRYVADRNVARHRGRYRVQVGDDDPSKSFCTDNILEVRCYLLALAYPEGSDGSS